MCHITHYEYSMFAIGFTLATLFMYLAWYMQWLGYSRHRDVPVDDIWHWRNEPKNEHTFRREMCDVFRDGKHAAPIVFRSKFIKGVRVQVELDPCETQST